MDFSRIQKEFRAVGIEVDYLDMDGKVKAHGGNIDVDIHDALMLAHTDNITEYITINLETNTNSVALKALLFTKFSEPQATTYWNNYLGLQLATIRALREEVYRIKSDSVFLDCVAEVGINGDLSRWQQARAEVQNMFPYPGTYR